MKPKSTLRSFLAIASSSLLAISSSHAATFTWANSNITATPPASLNWLNATQGTWLGGTPVINDNTTTIQFFENTTTSLAHTGNGATQTSVIDTPSDVAFQLGTLTLSGRASATNNAKLNLTLSGDALNFSAATGTINLDALNVDADQLITYNLNSNIQLGTASIGSVLTITGNGTSAFNIGGIISELKVGGGSLIKSGSSTVTLTGANSYTGTTTLNGGALVLSDLNVSIASSTGITLNGGNLTITNAVGQSAVDRVSNSAVITSNGGTITWTNPSLDTANWAETLGALSLTTGQTNIVSTNAVDAASTQVLTLGTGSLTHAASNTSAITFSGASLGTGTVNNIVITGQATTAANGIIGQWATYGTSVAAQTDYATYNITGGATNTLGIQGAGITASAQSLPWSTVHAATSNYTLANASDSALNGRLTATRNINSLRNTTAAGGAISVDAATDYVTRAGNTFADGDVVVLGTTAGGLTAGVPYYVRDYNGDAANGFKLAATSSGTAINITAANTGTITGGITLSNGNNLGTLGILNGSTIPLIIGGSGSGVVTLPSTTSGTLYVTPGASAINIAAPIADNGAGVLTLVKSGNNTLTLSGANTYTGGTTVNAGTLTISGTGTLGSGNYAGNIAIANNAVLNFANNTQTLGGNIANNGTLNFSGSGTTVDALYVVSGGISGSGSVNLNTSINNANATLTLSGNNTYTGKTSFGPGGIISTVTLSVSSFDYITSGTYANHGLGSSLGAPTTVANGTILIGNIADGSKSASAVLRYTGSGETTDRVLTFAFSQVNAQRTIDASGSGLLKFTSPFTYTSGPSGGHFPAVTLTGTGLGEMAAGITNLYTRLPITKSGTGTWTLSGSNSYTGATTITQGTLQVSDLATPGSNSSIGASTGVGGLVLSGGTLRYTGGSASTTRNFALAASSTIDASGTGALNFSPAVVSPDQNLSANFGTGQKVVTALSSTADLVVGMRVAGTNIGTANANVIASIDSATQITLVNNTIGVGSATPLAFGYTATARTLTLAGTNTDANTIAGILQDTSAAGAGVLNLTKAGIGTWVLGGANTYTGTNNVNLGILRGTQTSGTPFGTGAVTLNAGTLSLAPTGSGANVAVTGGTLAAATKFTFTGDAALSLNKGTQNSLTYTFGGSGATWVRGTNGTLILSVGAIANLGNTVAGGGERFIINGDAPATVNGLVSGVVAQDRGNGNASDFVTYDGTDGFKPAAYTLTNDFTGSANTSTVSISSATATSGPTAAYAIKVSGVTLTNTGNTLTLGSSGNPVASLILNGGTISGGILTTPTGSATELVIHTTGISAISSSINTATSQAGVSVFGPGTLDLSGSTGNTFTGGLRINNTTVIASNDNQLGGPLAGGNTTIILTGGTLQTSGTFSLGTTGLRAITLANGQNQTGSTFNVSSGTTTYQNASSGTKTMSGSGSLTKTGAGTLVFSGNTTNTYTGPTNINAGTLQLGANSMIADTVAINIGNATLDASTFTDTLGTLDPTASAVINLGSGGALAFANSSAVDWSGGTLNLTGTFVPGNLGSLRFGTSSSGLTPTQLGLISASGFNTFTLDVDGYLTAIPDGGGAPEIALDQGGNINTGGSKAFGTVTIGSPTSLIFTINNTGTTALNLTGTPKVAVSGANAADFTVTAQPAASVAGPGNTTFTVQFAPSASGARNAVLSIVNNDATDSENPFIINVSGTGQTQYVGWSGASDFDADTNGDGVKNGLAFLLGATNKNVSALNKLPTVTKDISGNLIMTFQCLKDASRGSSTLNVEHSSNLGISDAWLAAPVTDAGLPLNNVIFSVGSASATLNNVTATISNIEAASGKLFGRLKANP